MDTLNLGILAHVDAGKTSLTERLLFNAGVIDEAGSVDDGSTQTDSLALERCRGITIKSAVVSFPVQGVTVNLIDTPGHPDFIAEVERVLSVLDGAVLVVSAVEGVQAQTRVLMAALRRLDIPTLIFVNKIDRAGARYEHVLRSIPEKLAVPAVAMGSAEDQGTRGARYRPYSAADAGFVSGLLDVLADGDDALLAAYVADESAVSYQTLRHEFAEQAKQAHLYPVFFGSATTGAGVDALSSGITELLHRAGGDAAGPVAGTVFKVERGRTGEKVAYVRMFSGTVRVRERLRFGPGGEGKATSVSVFTNGQAVPHASVTAGQIAKVWGLPGVRIGDAVGGDRAAPPEHHFAPPSLETVVLPRRRADTAALHLALTQLAEQDPLINLREDGLRHEVRVSLYGEVQKEVIQATLADEFGVEVTFRETTTICVERPAGTGAAVEIIDKAPNPFLATVGLRVDPAPIGSGVRFGLEVELGAMPPAFFKAVEDTVQETLAEGLCGWQVTDCLVTMTHCGYWARQSAAHAVFDKSMSSTAGDFRNLTPLVLMSALKKAGTTVHEPLHHFRLEIPADTTGAVLPVLANFGAVPHSPTVRGSFCVLEGEVPAGQVHGLTQQLPGLTRGEGVLESAFSSYRQVRGDVPARPRTDHNPLDRKEYLLQTLRRTAVQRA
ncbi:MAG TPA: translation factor GTPase family protein [Streptosporangiaceae bacterium]|nr:translation factor GTPase family protein [Streptosporangiaceae bacterium]